jgi:hypothetical protein
MKSIGLKILIALSVSAMVSIGLIKTNAQVIQSKQPIHIPQPQKSPISAEQIEGINVLRTSGQIVAPRSFEAMVESADLIVIGRPSQSLTESTAIVKRDSAGYLDSAVSQTEFKVSRILKGKVDSKTILVGQQAAIVKENGDTVPLIVKLEDYQPLVKNAKYILFLTKGLNGRSWYFPAGVYFGKINLDGKDQAEKNTNFAPEVRAIHAAAKMRYRVEVDQPD